MKLLFATPLSVLLLASGIVYLSYPEVQTDTPVIYWVTDPNPLRHEQIRLFHEWLIDQGYVDDKGRPMVELRLDSANRDVSKQIIQGVSGVAGDIMDSESGGNVRYFHSIGLLEDVTDAAVRLGFDTTQTFDVTAPEVVIDGRQYAFPCNATVSMLWVNVHTFEKLGLPVPPPQWTFEQFEQQGKAFVTAANAGKARRDTFFCDVMPLQIMHRSLGLSVFNETMTACTLDDPRYVRCLNLKYKWMYVDRLLPTQADVISFGTQAGYGGSRLQLFNRGQYGMFVMGRYALIKLRRFGALDLTVVEPPHGGFPNTLASTRCASVYIGGDHPSLAVYFLSFLASEEYNMQIVRDADALPPNPKFTTVESFLRPPDHPNEWGLHGAFADAARNIGISGVYSPFVLSSVVTRTLMQVEDAFLNDQLAAAQAAEHAQRLINLEVRRSLAEDSSLQPLYERLSADQHAIDRLRAAGKPVPLDLITNPFYRRYYTAMGWTE